VYVAVAGNIGVGKSTVTSALALACGLQSVMEAVDENPYLADFYRDRRRWALHSQLFFLARRLEQHITLVNGRAGVIQDRTIYEDAEVFARALLDEGTLDARDHRVYSELYGAAARTLRAPDLLVYLRSSVPVLLGRIAVRGRGFEGSIEASYLGRLNALYDAWFAGYDLGAKVLVDADRYDFANDPRDVRALVEQLGLFGLSRAGAGASGVSGL
jgi:deoxyadenosine/deoxycytidine kinase